MCEWREYVVPVAGSGDGAKVRQHVCYEILFIESIKTDAGPAGDSRNGREGLTPEELGRRQEVKVSALWELAMCGLFIQSPAFFFCIYCYHEWEECGCRGPPAVVNSLFRLFWFQSLNMDGHQVRQEVPLPVERSPWPELNIFMKFYNTLGPR